MKEKSGTLCPAAWKHLAISPSGTVRLCCNSVPKIGISRDKQGVAYRVPSNWRGAFNSEMFRRVRRKMLQGQWAPECAICEKDEKMGGHSDRMQWLKKFPDLPSAELSEEAPLGEVFELDLRLGNLCNLKCRMCSPYSSSAWMKEWDTVGDLLPAIPESNKKRLQINWQEDEESIQSIRELIPHLGEVYLTGGEPLLSKGGKNFLRACIDQGRAGKMAIRYNTNGTIWDDELMDIWRHFSRIVLKISLDGIGPVNDYIRFPSKWSETQANLRRYREIQGLNLSIQIQCTLQAYNIFHAPEFLAYAKNLGYPVSFHFVENPSFLSLQVLPEKIAELSREKLKDLDHPQRNNILGRLNSDRQAEWPTFLEYTNRLDAKRGQKFSGLPDAVHFGLAQ